MAIGDRFAIKDDSGADVLRVDSDGALVPGSDNVRDLGTAALSWNDLFVDGTATIATMAPSGNLNFAKETAHTLNVAASTSSAAAGGNLSIAAGAGAATNGVGGTLALAGGAANGSGAGGNVTLLAGDSPSGTDGTVSIGTSNTSAVTLGSASAAVGVTGDLTVGGNTTLGDASTDTLMITAATTSLLKAVAHTIKVADSTDSNSGGGALQLQGGAGAATNAAGGNVNVYAGAGAGSGNGGNVVIQAGAQGGGGGSHGQVQIGGANTLKTVIHGLTYPTADGTSNQVLKTNGSGVLAFASAVYAQSEATGTLTDEQILAMNATPVTLIAAPAAGMINVVDEIELFLDYGSAAYVRDGGNEELVIEYSGAVPATGGVDIHAFATATDTFLTSGADAYRIIRPTVYNSAAANFDPATADAEAIQARITNSEVITGDSHIKWKIRYRTITLLT